MDIDGVLNSGKFFKEEHKKWKAGLRENKDYPQKELDIKLMENLKWIIDKTNAKIVLSSTWRRSSEGRQRVKENFDLVGLPYFIDCTPVQPANDIPRGNDIQKWIDDNKDNYDIEKFVILDDDSDMEHLMNYLVKCDFETGLTKAIAEKVIILLG